MDISLSNPVSAVSFLDVNPVVISLGRSTDVIRAEELSLTTSAEQVCSEVVLLYETAKKCNDTLSGEIAVLNQKNTDLGQKLEESMGLERDLKVLQESEKQTLNDEVALLQAEMNQLREVGQKETERLQKLLEAVPLDKTAALEAAKSSREHQKAQINQETACIQACIVPARNQVGLLKSQVSVLTTNLNSYSSQVPSLTGQRDSLQRQVDAVDAREIAKLKEIENFFNSFLDKVIALTLPGTLGADHAYRTCKAIFSAQLLAKTS